MNLDAEVAHVTTLVTRSNKRKAPHLVWRGWHFYETRTGIDYRSPIVTRRVSADSASLIVNYRKRSRRFNLSRWVETCVYEVFHAPMLSAQPYDRIPWEIHRVYPLDAYLAALESYRASV